MAIMILPPRLAEYSVRDESPDSPSSDTSMPDSPRPTKRHHASSTHLVTPGESITDDAQWMRGHGTYTQPPTSIIASVAGKVLKTNKLLSITPLHARYVPAIGDLVIGRITHVQTSRCLVNIAAPLLASLPLSAITLPGGIQRRRTATDELAMRGFFSEGDVLVAEVQAVRGDGSAALHTRSTRFGKLRDGKFMRVRDVGRGKSQVWRLDSSVSGVVVEVIAGVNGWLWVGSLRDTSDVKVTKLEEEHEGGEKWYSQQNSHADEEVRTEVSRVVACIAAVDKWGGSVDEEKVNRVYEASRFGDEGLFPSDTERLVKSVIQVDS